MTSKSPANWKLRAGRPRWEPGPGLRKAGWRGLDLKDAKGGWLSEGASIDRAREINGAVAAWRAGQLVAEAWAPIAPPGACATASLTRQQALDRRSIGALIDRYAGPLERPIAQALPSACREFRQLKPQTQALYRCKLKRLLDVLAGFVHVPAPGAPAAERKAYAAAVLAVRGFCVDVFEPPPFGSQQEPMLKTAYWIMRDEAGHHMANGTLRVASAWLQWCIDEDRSVRLNAAKLVKTNEAPGRIRPGAWEEVFALVKAADAMGYASIGDAVVLGVDLSWSQQDRLALTWPQISAESRVRGVRGKTGRAGETRLLPSLGIPRVEAIRARQLATGAQHTHVVVCETTGARWAADHYRHTFAEVRAEAAKACPSVADLRDQDLRDTAVTIAYEAGLTEPEIASRTLHSLKQIRAILDAHYGDISRQVGDNGAAKLEAYMNAKGVKL